MAGLFPGISNSQNVDRNGVPLANAVLTVYQGGTLTLASCFQDIGLAISRQNPMTADVTGRLPIFYVADGIYRVRLVDQYGVLVYDYPQVASIGASASGGGGTAVDATTIFQTGDPLWLPVTGTRNGWVRMNARTIGSATSGASERANADCQNLFLYNWNTFPDAVCPVTGGRGASAAADWAANKIIATPNMRLRGPFGLADMGNTRLTDFDALTFTYGDPVTAAALLGAARKTLAISEIPVITPTGTIAGSISGSISYGPGTVYGDEQAINILYQTGGTTLLNILRSPNLVPMTLSHNLTFAGTFTGTPFGGGAAFDKMPTAILGTWYQKL